MISHMICHMIFHTKRMYNPKDKIIHYVQWNPSSMDTNGQEKVSIIIEVSLFQG